MRFRQSAYEYQRAIEARDKKIIGVNEYVTEEKREQKLFEPDPHMKDEQVERLKRTIREKECGEVQ